MPRQAATLCPNQMESVRRDIGQSSCSTLWRSSRTMRRTFKFARGRCAGGTLQLLVSPDSAAKTIRSRLLRLAETAPDLTFIVFRILLFCDCVLYQGLQQSTRTLILRSGRQRERSSSGLHQG